MNYFKINNLNQIKLNRYHLFINQYGYFKMCDAPMLTQEEYAKCFNVFVKRSHEYEEMMKGMIDCVSSMNNNSIRMLSIGAGTGYFDKNILETLKFRGINVEYYAFEPNPVHLKGLQKRIPDGRIIGDYYRSDSTHETIIDKKFDIILLCQCLYPMPDPYEIVVSTLKLLSPNGRTIVFHHSDGDMTNYVKHFNKFMDPNRKVRDDQTLSAQDIARYLTIRNIKFQFRELDGYIDMTDIWNETNQLYEMITFFIQTNSRHLSEDLYEKMVDKLKKDTYDDRYHHSTGMIIIG